ncbi:MAG TPA: hypothetical protein VF746_29930 [Longimicrobium sp.]
MTQLALPLVSAVLAFVAGLLFGLRVEWVTGGIALAAVPLLLAPWAYRWWIGQPIRGDVDLPTLQDAVAALEADPAPLSQPPAPVRHLRSVA